MLEIEPKSRDRVYKVKTFGTLHIHDPAKNDLYENARATRQMSKAI